MTFGAFHSQRKPPMMASMADINVTPMVDVMLVLLVIFIITAPMFTQAVKLDLPRAESSAAPAPAQSITLAIDGQGSLYWNDEALGSTLALAPGWIALDAKLTQAAILMPQPELQLRFDRETRYEVVAQVMAAAQAKGLSRLGFVTDPGLPATKEKK